MVKSGVRRKIDQLGRVVIPREFRQELLLKTGDTIEISLIDQHLIMQKYSPLTPALTDIVLMCQILSELSGEKVGYYYRQELLAFDQLATEKRKLTSVFIHAAEAQQPHFATDIQVYLDDTKTMNFYYFPTLLNQQYYGAFVLEQTHQQSKEAISQQIESLNLFLAEKLRGKDANR